MGCIESYSRLIATKTYTVLALQVAGIALLTVIVLALDALQVQSLLQFDWYIAGEKYVDYFEAVNLAFDELSQEIVFPTRSQLLTQYDCCSFYIMYEFDSSERADVFTQENVKAFCEFESFFLNHPDYPLYCKTADPKGYNTSCDPQDSSVVSIFYDTSQASLACELLDQAYIDSKLSLLEESESSFVGNDGNLLRSKLEVAGPLGADSTFDKDFGSIIISTTGEQYAIFRDFFVSVQELIFLSFDLDIDPLFSSPYHVTNIPINVNSRVRFYSEPLYQLDTIRTGEKDVSFVVFAILLVYAFSYNHVRSHFLCIMMLTMIMLSLPVASFFYRVVFQIEYFTNINMIVLFIILGIGADGFYVLYDAWKQSAVFWSRVYSSDSSAGLLEENRFGTGDLNIELVVARLIYAFRRASSSVFYTAFTTVAAFLATATSPLIPMRTFGLFAAFVVSANFIWTMTVFPAIIVIHDKKIRPLRLRCSKRSRIPCEMYKLDHSKSIDSVDSNAKNITEERTTKHSAFAYFYVDSMLYKTTIRQCGFEIRPVALLSIILSLVMFILLFQRAVLLNTPTGPDEFFRPVHMLRGFLVEFNAASSAGDISDFTYCQLAFGIDGIDRNGYSQFKPNGFRGTAVFKEDFDIFTRESFQYLMDVCDQLEVLKCEDSSGNQLQVCTSSLLIHPGSMNCITRDFYIWYNETMPRNNSLLELIDNDPDIVESLFIQFVSNENSNNTNAVQIQAGIVEDKLQFLVIDFGLALKRWTPASKSGPALNLIVDAIQRLEKEAPSSIKPFALATFELVWFITQNEIVNSLFRGFFICFPIVFVILLLATGNILLALLAVTTIFAIVFSCLGFVEIMGWALGIGEVLLAIMVIGLSVDYVIHLGHMYADAGRTGMEYRSEKFKYSALLMMDTLIAAWLTTALSALIMIFAVSQYFVKMAVLISSAITLSIFYSFSLFLPLCLTIGPESEFAQLLYNSSIRKEPSSDELQEAEAVNDDFVHELIRQKTEERVKEQQEKETALASMEQGV